jgi:hypothetical protein
VRPEEASAVEPVTKQQVPPLGPQTYPSRLGMSRNYAKTSGCRGTVCVNASQGKSYSTCFELILILNLP